MDNSSEMDRIFKEVGPVEFFMKVRETVRLYVLYKGDVQMSLYDYGEVMKKLTEVITIMSSREMVRAENPSVTIDFSIPSK